MRVNDLHTKYRALGLTDAQISRMTIRELHEFEHGKGCRADVGSDAQKGAEMATTKNVAMTTAAETEETTMTTAETKETTMTETTLTKEEKAARREAEKAAHRVAHKKALDDLFAKGIEPAFEGDPIAFTKVLDAERTGSKKKIQGLLTKYGKQRENDERELLALRMFAALKGWSNGFATESQASWYKGAPAEGAEGWEIQSGDGWWFTVYPYESFVWEKGEPEYDEERAAKKALHDAVKTRNRANKKEKEAKKALDALTKPEKPASKADAQLKAENDELRKQLKEQSEQITQMQAMMAQVLAKLA